MGVGGSLVTSGRVGFDEMTMCEQQPAEQSADEATDTTDDVSIDEMVERVRRWLFEGGSDPTPT